MGISLHKMFWEDHPCENWYKSLFARFLDMANSFTELEFLKASSDKIYLSSFRNIDTDLEHLENNHQNSLKSVISEMPMLKGLVCIGGLRQISLGT